MTNVDDLLASLLAEPDGQLSPSVYETGRLVALAPWLTGHRDRWNFLLNTQHPDGSWGGPDEYGLVPTLSAVDAVLTSMARDQPDQFTLGRLRRAADAGARWLSRRLGSDDPVELPDTVAVELIVPPLVERFNEHFAVGDATPWHPRLCVPRNLDATVVAAIRARIGAGGTVPTKLAQSLEIASPEVSGAGSVTAYRGAVGCAPAATAAWLTDDLFRAQRPDSVAYLTGLVARHGGPVPTVIPITEFERAWVLADLVRSGIPCVVPPELLAAAEAAVADGPTPGGLGMPPDADTTSSTLFSLSRLGRHRAPDCLFDFELDTHFCCWHGERTFSPTANAHVLESFHQHVTRGADDGLRYRAAGRKIVRFLADCQLANGSWTDKWHASPYYATACCVPALRIAHGDRTADTAVDRAVAWVLATQRADGSWGRWAPTAEETAYALRVLIAADPPDAAPAIERGAAYLLEAARDAELPPLWHGKDLYTPVAVVRATIAAAVHEVRSWRAAGQIAS